MTQRSTLPMTRVLGGAMIGAPVLLLASTVAYAAGGGLGGDEMGGAIQVYAMAAWILVVIGLTRLLEHPFPGMAAILTVVGALGVAGGIAYGVDSIHVGAFGTTAEEAGTAGPLALQLPGLLFPLANLALGLAMVRAKVAPRWSGLLLAVAAVLFPISRIPSVEALALVADAAFVVALAPLGWAMWQGRDPATAGTDRSGRTHTPVQA